MGVRRWLKQMISMLASTPQISPNSPNAGFVVQIMKGEVVGVKWRNKGEVEPGSISVGNGDANQLRLRMERGRLKTYGEVFVEGERVTNDGGKSK
jgi:hypothetical protein